MHPYHRPDLQNFTPRDLQIHGEAITDLIKEILAQGGLIRLGARGSSMTPFINDGDMITIAPLRKKNPGVGDVIAFHHLDSKSLVVHRIIRRAQNNFIVKGDNEPDHPGDVIPGDRILGVVVHIERNHREVRFGLGLERGIVAWLSQKGWLFPLRLWLARIRRRS